MITNPPENLITLNMIIMKKYLLIIFFSLGVSTSFISCRETQDVAEETVEAVDEGVEEAAENTGLGGNDDL